MTLTLKQHYCIIANDLTYIRSGCHSIKLCCSIRTIRKKINFIGFPIVSIDHLICSYVIIFNISSFTVWIVRWCVFMNVCMCVRSACVRACVRECMHACMYCCNRNDRGSMVLPDPSPTSNYFKLICTLSREVCSQWRGRHNSHFRSQQQFYNW